VGLLRDGTCRTGRWGRCCGATAATCDLDVGHDVVAPVADGLDRLPDLVLLGLRRYGALVLALAVTLFRVAVELSLGFLDCVAVLVSQIHVMLLPDMAGTRLAAWSRPSAQSSRPARR